ncbi:hypothetical protein [Streptantibioticus silvisoli]|nr:hypothetical protein [Streptantibioticus silvisoli]
MIDEGGGRAVIDRIGINCHSDCGGGVGFPDPAPSGPFRSGQKISRHMLSPIEHMSFTGEIEL